MIDIERIKSAVKNFKFSSHAKEEMLYEESGVIYEDEIKEAVKNGETQRGIVDRYS